MNASNTYPKLLLYIALICIGIAIGIAIRHYYNLPLAESINLVDLATLVATIFLAVYIPGVLDRKLQVTRDKKELVEEHFNDLKNLLRKSNLLLQGEQPIKQKDLLVLKNTLDIIDHKLHTTVILLRYTKWETQFNKEISNIRRLIKQYKTLLW